MNRRDFIGAVAIGSSAVRLLDAPLASAQQGTASQPRATWIRNGLIDAGGSHEPYIFVVRRGGEPLNARKEYEAEQSEELIHRLHDQGVEVFHTHLYKGFGMAAEMPDMEEAKRVAEIVHRYGMKVDSYIQWNTMMYETFFAEEPHAKEWIQRDISGLPILLTYGYQQSFRYRPCFTHQEYLDYLKKIVRYAVQEVKTDFIHFDNFDLNPEPDSCHCAACVEGFRNYLKMKYTPELRRARFGFENVDFVNPPQWNRDNPPEKMQIIFDPAIQEWVDFRCQVMADALRQEAEYARSLNSEVVIEINPHGITGGNRAWMNGIDHARLLTTTDVFWTEEENPSEYFPDGRLVSKIRSYKLARAFDNVLLAYIADNPVAMAECLAFDQTLGFAGVDPLPPEMVKHIAFYRRNRELFLGTEDVGPVGVLRSYASITYHNARAQLSAILVEQALIQSRIPFRLVFDEPLPDLSGLEVLVLPDTECLSDEQIRQIRDYVNSGGGLVATGHAGFYDEWRRTRVEPGLQGLVDGQGHAADYEESVQSLNIEGGKPRRKEVGKGRVVYIPGVVFDGKLPEPEEYFTIDNRYWKRPKNWLDIVESVRWAGGDTLPVEVSGPDFLVANVVRQAEKQRIMIHLVNYNFRKMPEIRAIEVKCLLPVGKTARSVQAYRVESSEPVPVEFHTESTGVRFTIPRIGSYAVAVVSW
jgi:Beta-galactosidase